MLVILNQYHFCCGMWHTVRRFQRKINMRVASCYKLISENLSFWFRLRNLDELVQTLNFYLYFYIVLWNSVRKGEGVAAPCRKKSLTWVDLTNSSRLSILYNSVFIHTHHCPRQFCNNRLLWLWYHNVGWTVCWPLSII